MRTDYLSEAKLEKRLVKGSKKLDCLVFKTQFINQRGCPDRLIITPNGAHFWVEMKTSRGRLSNAQKRVIATLLLYHQKVQVLSSTEEADGFLRMLECY
ncbi:hypothetical protein WSI_05350 [Candidatus Liberibacter asiaticus str. gxpsy]|uniref:VRR-NUC domain-containing protein n=1 Tax=Candidatus Liberibacter asiaticus str. gxpsy TaxID=1174529 RepID=A0ABM5NFN0_LIBAS|nr:hypothetical protein [Candidatus Liberibacter asiaticus]AGH17427.1 hypothetical protein WSI_05350 [Candidatus Liberibacter asiaticus str. gxpsy]